MHVLKPAYGRKYYTYHEVENSYEQGFDFDGDVSLRFQLCSCRDFLGETVEIRFGQDLEFHVVINVCQKAPMTEEMKKLNNERMAG